MHDKILKEKLKYIDSVFPDMESINETNSMSKVTPKLILNMRKVVDELYYRNKSAQFS